jgi:hypothetical protein
VLSEIAYVHPAPPLLSLCQRMRATGTLRFIREHITWLCAVVSATV